MEHLAEEFHDRIVHKKVPLLPPHEEHQYLQLLRDILQKGSLETGRNGRTKSLFGSSMRFSLAGQRLPLLTTKKVAWKTCLKELLWFLRGQTDNHLLQEQGVHIWDANASKEFLTSRGLDYPEGELGPIYGRQWRHFDADFSTLTGKRTEGSEGIDQLMQVIEALKDPEKRNSRRLLMTAWNPLQLDAMALPPCHVLCQFRVSEGDKLSCAMYQRSVDMICGLPFNIASYSFLTHLLAKHCGLKAHELVLFLGDCHIYEEHFEAARLQTSREPCASFPRVCICNEHERIEDYEVQDVVVSGYKSHEPIKVTMVP